MTNSTSASERFQALLAEFCASVQMPVAEDALGIEFEADGYLVLVAPDPRDADRMLVEVSVTRLEGAPPNLMTALLRLNHQSRLEHDWVISVDPADQLCLHTQREISRTRDSDLQALLAEGIERAQAMQDICQALTANAETAMESGLTAAAIDPMLMIRG